MVKLTKMLPKAYLCFDIGATTTKVGLIKPQSTSLLATSSFFTCLREEFVLAYLVKKIKQIIQTTKTHYQLLGIGIATTGGVDCNSQTVIYTNKAFKAYRNTNWRQLLQPITPLKIVVMNDAKAASLYEFSQRQTTNAVMLTLGTGFGVSLQWHQKIYYGSHFLAGEIGHLRWIEAQKKHETFDSVLSVVLVTKTIAQILNNPKVKLSDNVLIQQNTQAYACKQVWLQNVAKALVYLQSFYDPELFIIGGGVSVDPLLLSGIKVYLPPNFSAQIETALMGNYAAFFGLLQLF